jgi:hypothetical protein
VTERATQSDFRMGRLAMLRAIESTLMVVAGAVVAVLLEGPPRQVDEPIVFLIPVQVATHLTRRTWPNERPEND